MEIQPLCRFVESLCRSPRWATTQLLIGPIFLQILKETVEDAGLIANLVSNASESTLIHKTIVENLYRNPIVICDVSGKNPNVMFELGLRLAFDRPTIIVKDDRTGYSFDTREHRTSSYPRDLRFAQILDFKQKLREKIVATLAASQSEGYSTFLKHFGEFTVPKIKRTKKFRARNSSWRN